MPSKTKEATAIACRVPLTPRAFEIVQKYRVGDGVSHPKMPLFDFPKYSQTYNDKLKRVFQKAGLNRTVVVFLNLLEKDIDALNGIDPLFLRKETRLRVIADLQCTMAVSDVTLKIEIDSDNTPFSRLLLTKGEMILVEQHIPRKGQQI